MSERWISSRCTEQVPLLGFWVFRKGTGLHVILSSSEYFCRQILFPSSFFTHTNCVFISECCQTALDTAPERTPCRRGWSCCSSARALLELDAAYRKRASVAEWWWSFNPTYQCTNSWIVSPTGKSSSQHNNQSVQIGDAGGNSKVWNEIS